jgi:nucleotide-binding universal stress UspA family protein
MMNIQDHCLLVGYDGSEQGTAALRWALEHAPPDGQVLAVAVLGSEPVPVPGGERVARVGSRLLQDDRPVWQAWEVDAEAVGDEAELIVERGMPAAVLLRIAAERGADLIVLGRHHRRLGAVLPSVLRDVLHATEIPVVVVP